MSPPVMAAVIIGVALGTLMFFLYGNQTDDQQEQEQSYSNNRCGNNVGRVTRWPGNDECCICFNPLRTEPSMSLACRHNYHTKCIQKWKRLGQGPPSCPTCRAPF